jgi:hypothetical protein
LDIAIAARVRGVTADQLEPGISLHCAFHRTVDADGCTSSLWTTIKTLTAVTAGYCVGKLPALLAILSTVAQSQRSGELKYDSPIDTPILYTESDFLYSDRHMWTYTQVVRLFSRRCVSCFCSLELSSGGAAEAIPPRSIAFRFRPAGSHHLRDFGIGDTRPVRNLLIPAFQWLGRSAWYAPSLHPARYLTRWLWLTVSPSSNSPSGEGPLRWTWREWPLRCVFAGRSDIR